MVVVVNLVVVAVVEVTLMWNASMLIILVCVPTADSIGTQSYSYFFTYSE